jgi:hypothetical protein
MDLNSAIHSKEKTKKKNIINNFFFKFINYYISNIHYNKNNNIYNTNNNIKLA